MVPSNSPYEKTIIEQKMLAVFVSEEFVLHLKVGFSGQLILNGSSKTASLATAQLQQLIANSQHELLIVAIESSI